MSTATVELRSLAAQARRGNAEARAALQHELEDNLEPLVRCALRRGAGLPAVVQWVQKNAAALGTVDLSQAAPRIARLLSAGLIEELGPRERRPGLETVLGS
jgi:hypothetical protein